MPDVFTIHLEWSGAAKAPPSAPTAFSRDLDVRIGATDIAMSAAPDYRGDPSRVNPEQLLVAAVSACQALTYLYLAAKNGIPVLGYADDAEGHLAVIDGRIRMARVTLRPRIRLGEGADAAKAGELIGKAHDHCFITNSVSATVEIEPQFERLAA
jgi:organic hydroperoxide reductase OsmC/OhrA